MQFDPSTMKVKICSNCHGIGKALVSDLKGGTEEITCENCEGTGRVVEVSDITKLSLPAMLEQEGYFEKGVHRPYVCPYCKGLGSPEFGYDGKCGECDGTGRMVKKVIKTIYQLSDMDGQIPMFDENDAEEDREDEEEDA